MLVFPNAEIQQSVRDAGAIHRGTYLGAAKHVQAAPGASS